MAKQKRKNWNYFRDGEVLKKAGVKVLEREKTGPTHTTTEYLIRYTNHLSGTKHAKKTHIVTHAHLAERIRKNRSICPECAQIKNAQIMSKRHADRQSIMVRYMHWPAPPSILADPPRIRIA